LILSFRDRRRARTVQDALVRYERILAQGADPAAVGAEIGASLDKDDALGLL
jgi:hypothetical protein